MSRVRAYDQKTKNFTPICFNLNVFSLSSICCYFFCLSFQFSPIPDYNYILANKTKKKESNQSIYVLFRVISKKKSKYVYSRLSCTVIVLCDVAYFCFLLFFLNMHTPKTKTIYTLFALYMMDVFSIFLVLKSYIKRNK
jgi:hypothetical protein